MRLGEYSSLLYREKLRKSCGFFGLYGLRGVKWSTVCFGLALVGSAD
jgi:hypothetical protein